jgi:hypothetical protein
MSEMEEEQEIGAETPEADAVEQRIPVRDRGCPQPPARLPLDVDEADLIEQRTPAQGQGCPEPPGNPLPFDADDADVAEQKEPVQLDDDDYR